MLNKGNNHLKNMAKDYRKGEYRLGYHLMPICGWFNDPHNPVVFDGKYHLFYNLYPFGTEQQFAPKFWAHAISDDMVNFTYIPCAIAPDSEMDSDGCASGCAFVKGGSLYLAYTGRNRSLLPKEKQAIAVSQDGINFIKANNRQPVLVTDAETGENLRDPRIFEHKGRYIMLLGNTWEKRGRVLGYSSTDLLNWKEEGVFCEGDGSLGFMWECPDYQIIEGKEFLILSVESELGEKDTGATHRAGYFTGSINDEGTQFILGDFYYIDKGLDFYAPQAYDHKDGRKMLVAWMDRWHAKTPTKELGWVGALIIPRELSVNEKGMLQQEPARELKSLRKEGICKEELCLEDVNAMEGVFEHKFELRFKVDLGATQAEDIELVLRSDESGSEYTAVTFHINKGDVTIDKLHSGEGDLLKYTAELNYVRKDFLEVVIFADVSSLEILINKGTTSITNRIYPKGSSKCLSLCAKGGEARLLDFEFYPLKDNEVSFDF